MKLNTTTAGKEQNRLPRVNHHFYLFQESSTERVHTYLVDAMDQPVNHLLSSGPPLHIRQCNGEEEHTAVVGVLLPATERYHLLESRVRRSEDRLERVAHPLGEVIVLPPLIES